MLDTVPAAFVTFTRYSPSSEIVTLFICSVKPLAEMETLLLFTTRVSLLPACIRNQVMFDAGTTGTPGLRRRIPRSTGFCSSPMREALTGSMTGRTDEKEKIENWVLQMVEPGEMVPLWQDFILVSLHHQSFRFICMVWSFQSFSFAEGVSLSEEKIMFWHYTSCDLGTALHKIVPLQYDYQLES